ncbi:MAG: S8 family serine peptidase [Woeseiaceae bacterium]|nr:S8 family serine peptidase [Woeseiaceae bacterium]
MTNKNARLSALVLALGAIASVSAEIVVTGSSRFHRDELPHAIQVVSNEELVRARPQTVSELLAGLPGVNTGSRSDPVYVRGSGLANEGALDPMVLVNGTRVSGGLSAIDPEVIDSIDVVKGPAAAAIYGSDALAGVINITTKPGYELGDPAGSATLPTVQATLSNYSLATQNTEYCDAADGAYAKTWAWFGRHNYGVGEFSSDRSTQFWGSVDSGFAPRHSAPPFLWSAESPGGGQKQESVSPYASFMEWYGLYQRIVGSPAIPQDHRMLFAITMMFNYATLNRTYSDAAAVLGVFDPDHVFNSIETAYGENPSGVQADGTAILLNPQPRYTYKHFQEFLWKLYGHPTLPQGAKAEILYSLLFSNSMFHPMFSDASYFLGSFDPDYMFEEITSEFDLQAASTQFTEFQKMLERLAQHPLVPATDMMSITIAMIMNYAVLSDDYSDAAYALGLFDPDEVYEATIEAYRSQYYYAIPDNTSVELIDESAELLEEWHRFYQKLMGDPDIPEQGKLKILNGLLFYSLAVNEASAAVGSTLRDFDADLLFDQFFSVYGVAPAEDDPFTEHFLPPLSAFDLRYCKPEEVAQMRDLIRRRDVKRDVVTQLWDYHRHPDTPDSEKAEVVSEILDADATMAQLNLDLQLLWRQCSNYEAPALAGDSSAKVDSAEPAIEVRVVRSETDQSGNQSFIPAVGTGVELKRNNFGMTFDLPYVPGSFKDEELDAATGSSRVFSDERGIASPMGVYSKKIWDESRIDDWTIAYNAEERVIGIQVEQSKIDSVVQHFGGMGRPGMTFDQLPKETLDAIDPRLRLRATVGESIRHEFVVTYNFQEDLRDLDIGTLFSAPGSTHVSNDLCGDSALPPEGAGYLTAEQSPVKSVGDRWAIEHVGVDAAARPAGAPVTIAVIDTGIDWNHRDIEWNSLWRNEDEIPGNSIDDDRNGYVDDVIGWDFMGQHNRPWDNDGHGTFVAGLIAATRGNDEGIDGINPAARIMVLKALNNFGRTRASYVARAIVYAVDNGAQIINISITGPGFPKVVQDAVNYANSEGVLVVVAAGNRAEDIDTVQPTHLRDVLIVGATDSADRRAVFSNVGSAVSLGAPGVDIVSLRARATDFMYARAETAYVKGDAFMGEDARYYRTSGTSFAAPIVSGIASLVLANRPELTREQLKRILEQSARDIETPGRDRLSGYGVVDARAALAADPEFFIEADIPAVQLLKFDGANFLQVVGTADANLFARARLEIGQGEDPTSWIPVGETILERATGAELGRIPVETLGAAGTWTIRLVVEHAAGRSREARYIIELS